MVHSGIGGASLLLGGHLFFQLGFDLASPVDLGTALSQQSLGDFLHQQGGGAIRLLLNLPQLALDLPPQRVNGFQAAELLQQLGPPGIEPRLETGQPGILGNQV